MESVSDSQSFTFRQDGVTVTIQIAYEGPSQWRPFVNLTHVPVLIEVNHRHSKTFSSLEEAREAAENYARAKIADVLSRQIG